MFKFLKKSTYENLTADLFDANEKVDELSHALELADSHNDSLENEVGNLKDELNALKKEHSEYLESTIRGNMNEVVIQIGDNLTQLNPLVRWKPGVEEKLIEIGYLADGHVTNTSIQLALMMIAAEGIEQILEDHQPAVAETD